MFNFPKYFNPPPYQQLGPELTFNLPIVWTPNMSLNPVAGCYRYRVEKWNLNVGLYRSYCTPSVSLLQEHGLYVLNVSRVSYLNAGAILSFSFWYNRGAYNFTQTSDLKRGSNKRQIRKVTPGKADSCMENDCVCLNSGTTDDVCVRVEWLGESWTVPKENVFSFMRHELIC